MQQAEVAQKGFAILATSITLRKASSAIRYREAAAGLRHALRHPAVLAVAREARLRAIAQEVLGGDPFPFRGTLFDKSPISNWLVAWHQDKALPLRERRELAGRGP